MIPVSIITGFLGSGKTTLLNHIVRQPGMADTAVIVNEFGEIGIDHLLIEQAFEDTVLLENGCICCSIRGDLVDTLIDLERRVANGDLPPFGKAVVETTGLADPAPILQTLISEPRLQQNYVLDGIVATVDAVNAAGQLDEFEESVKQIALADHLLLTKLACRPRRRWLS
jgi:G3E family GTPase